MRPLSNSNSTSTAAIANRTIDVRGEPQSVAVYDFSRLQAQFAEHVNGTGFPGSYRLEGKLTDTQKVSLTFDADGKVQLLSRHFEPDPELGGVAGSYPTRVDPVRDLFPDEVQSLLKGLQSLSNVDPAYATILERIGGKGAKPGGAPEGLGAKHLQPGEGKPLGNGGGVRGGLGYEVVEPKTPELGKATISVRGAPMEVPLYDFGKVKADWAEHVDGTGYPGSYRLEGSLTQSHKISLTFDADGSVQLSSKHYEPDPELGGAISPEPSRYEPIRKLFPAELATLKQALQGQGGRDEAFAEVLKRLG